jgi:Ca-activated chloride channel family protein
MPKVNSLFLLLAVTRVAAAEPAPPDKTLSPYFLVEGAAPGMDALPLDSTRADIRIAGVIADVTVTQAYRNDGDRAISARYVFPASTRAAVYGMKMTIGDRQIVAKIKQREQAKQEFEAAKKAGKTATLLEEQRPNVFTMSVANILPKDRIQVELKYTELLVPTDGAYELVYPTVVGPRYASATTPATTSNQFVASPYTRAGVSPAHDVGIHVALNAGMTIQSVESPSHKIATTVGMNRSAATIDLDSSEHNGGNRDFVLRYRLSDDKFASGLLLFQGKTENFFLAMVQPPARPSPELIPPREYVFIVDVSGSMAGFPLETTKKLMTDLLTGLRPVDRFNVLLFSGTSALYAPASVIASQSELKKAKAFIDAQRGGGGTELLAAVQQAMQLPRPADNVSRSFVVVSDGYIAEEPAVFEHIRTHLGQANVWSLGIGSAVNRHLMEGIAKAGQGEAFTVLDPSQAAATAAKLRTYISTPVLTNVSVRFDGFRAYDVAPASLPDVFAQRPVIVFGKYSGAPAGKIALTGTSGRGNFTTTLDAAAVRPDANNAALSYLWARAKISELSDFYNDDANRDAVTTLGLQYNLLTKFTSFIAVSEIIRSRTGSIDVDVPSAMPLGVSDDAISAESEMAIGAEPPFAVLLAILAGIVGFVALRKRKLALV